MSKSNLTNYSNAALWRLSRSMSNKVLDSQRRFIDDLMAVLEARIDLIQLLLRKRRHASQTGNIYLRIHEIL